MQNVAAYLFKAELDSSGVQNRAASIENEISEWLKLKGAEPPTGETGSFDSLSGDGNGKFTRGIIKSSQGTIITTNLTETARTGQHFETDIQVIIEPQSITVFSTLSVSNEHIVIAPQSIYPRCPKIIRTLLTTHGDWAVGGQPVPRGTIISAHGEKHADALCKKLRDSNRRFPIIVISSDPEEEVWPNLAAEIAREMIGIADVSLIDEEGSWTMTDQIGKFDSCYLGAVRLYWPSNRGRLSSTVWTPSRLRTFGEDRYGMNRFLSLLRRTVMSMAALNITPPPCIRAIYASAIAERINQMEKSAIDRELNFLVEENHTLSEKLIKANNRISDLEWTIASLSRKNKNTSLDLSTDSDGAADESTDEDDSPPSEDGLTYYKKIGNKGGVDILVRTGPCNHKESSWKPAFKGDQAEKGILKLEGKNDWQSIQHCGACTGGGRWRVRW